jgi:hypothetical protein
MIPRPLERHCEWTAEDFADPAVYTEPFTPNELVEIDAAVAQVRDRADDLISLGKADFPLPTLAPRLKRIERELMDGRGFVLLRGVDRARYSNDEMCLIYWGIGAHLGRPWPQNKHGHVLGDVTDQGKRFDDPTARGNELGGISLGYHCDGSDLVGLMCLQTGVSGGLSAVANAVAIHNTLVVERPELAASLYEPLPYDFRGERRRGRGPGTQCRCSQSTAVGSSSASSAPTSWPASATRAPPACPTPPRKRSPGSRLPPTPAAGAC